MVKIINGEVVPDDDPRAQEWMRRQRQPGSSQSPFPNAWQHQQQQQGGAGGRQQMNEQSPTVEINNRLRAFGLSDLRLGQHVIEPMYLVAAVLGLVFWGIPGILIVAAIWFFMTRQQQ